MTRQISAIGNNLENPWKFVWVKKVSVAFSEYMDENVSNHLIGSLTSPKKK